MIYWRVFGILSLILATGSSVTFENNGYRDVVVSISPDVPNVNGTDIVNNIKVSLLLYRFFQTLSQNNSIRK